MTVLNNVGCIIAVYCGMICVLRKMKQLCQRGDFEWKGPARHNVFVKCLTLFLSKHKDAVLTIVS